MENKIINFVFKFNLRRRRRRRLSLVLHKVKVVEQLVITLGNFNWEISNKLSKYYTIVLINSPYISIAKTLHQIKNELLLYFLSNILCAFFITGHKLKLGFD